MQYAARTFQWSFFYCPINYKCLIFWIHLWVCTTNSDRNWSQILTWNRLACILTPPARQMPSEQYYGRRCLSVPLHHPIALGTNDTAAVQTRFIVRHSEMFVFQLANSRQSSSDTSGDRYISTPLHRRLSTMSFIAGEHWGSRLGNSVTLVGPTHDTSVPCNGWAFQGTDRTYLLVYAGQQ
jgi:hypothetical protein